MTPACAAVERYLHTHIPLSREMGLSVRSIDGGVLLAAPLEPNLNHRGTVFGGSLSALAILSAWTALHLRLRDEGVPGHIVIQRNQMEYLRPADGEFQAFCAIPEGKAWPRFLEAMRRRGRGRITLHSEVRWGGERVGALEGEFVATRPDPE